MAAYNKFNAWIESVVGKLVDLMGTAGSTADTLKLYLSDATPSASGDVNKADLAEIATGNGYTGAVSLANVGTRSGAVVTVTVNAVTVTAAGGSIGPFRYIAVFDDTVANDPLVCWFDYGSELTLTDGSSFTFRPNSSTPTGTLFTIG